MCMNFSKNRKCPSKAKNISGCIQLTSMNKKLNKQEIKHITVRTFQKNLIIYEKLWGILKACKNLNQFRLAAKKLNYCVIIIIFL